MWYITNGHLQCADCICYPEIGDPDFYQATCSLQYEFGWDEIEGKVKGTLEKTDVKRSMDTSQFETEKMGEFRKWMSHSKNVRN